MSKEEIGSQIKAYLETELLTEEAGNIENTTELISTGVLDSISVLTLVTFLEDTFDIQIKAREVGIDYMNTVDDIAGLVTKKQSA